MSAKVINSTALAFFLGAMFPLNAAAQTLPVPSIEEETLGAAQSYDIGVPDNAASSVFGPTLWNGTNVTIAKYVIENAPTRSRSLTTSDMVAGALLAGGAPPRGAEQDENYARLRLTTLTAMGRQAAAEQILTRQPNLEASPTGQQLKADAALSVKEIPTACTIADTIQEARTEPYWAKLRAFCHITRDEIAAGELTADLLRRTGHEDESFFKAMRAATGLSQPGLTNPNTSPLIAAMIVYSQGDGDSEHRLTASTQLDRLISNAASLSPAELDQALSRLALAIPDTQDVETAPVGGYFDLDETLADNHPSSWGKLYGVVKTSTDAATTAKAAAGLLERAQSRDIFAPIAGLIQQSLSVVPAGLKADYGLASFVRLAALEGDLLTLRTLYDSVPADNPMKSRIALASDALGNGFVLGELGQDMTNGLSASGTGQKRAVRDSFIAIALGARASDEAALALSEYSGTLSGRMADPGALLMLQAAAEKRATAETALRAGAILGEGGPSSLRDDSLVAVLVALRTAGLTSYAARLAAEDFID